MWSLFGRSARFISEGFSTKKGNGGIAFVSGSCAMFIRDVTIGVHRGQHICLPIDYSNTENIGDIHSNGERRSLFE